MREKKKMRKERTNKVRKMEKRDKEKEISGTKEVLGKEARWERKDKG